jgi:hypothetical protein
MTAIAACRTCGTEPLENARFCHGCGSPVKDGDTRAEYKQVTVLFADVVHSMDIAAAVGPERLREIMAELADRCAAAVKRYGGTVDKFTHSDRHGRSPAAFPPGRRPRNRPERPCRRVGHRVPLRGNGDRRYRRRGFRAEFPRSARSANSDGHTTCMGGSVPCSRRHSDLASAQ